MLLHVFSIKKSIVSLIVFRKIFIYKKLSAGFPLVLIGLSYHVFLSPPQMPRGERQWEAARRHQKAIADTKSASEDIEGGNVWRVLEHLENVSGNKVAFIFGSH